MSKEKKSKESLKHSKNDCFELSKEQQNLLKHRSELLHSNKTDRHSLKEIVARIKENSE